MRATAALLLGACLFAWLVPCFGGAEIAVAGAANACSNPHCVCPVPEDGSRCGCVCCAPHEHDDSERPTLCGKCLPDDSTPAVVTSLKAVQAPAIALPQPAARASLLLPRKAATIRCPGRQPDPIPRTRV